MRTLAFIALCVTLSACSGNMLSAPVEPLRAAGDAAGAPPPGTSTGTAAPLGKLTATGYFAGLPTGPAQFAALCDRGHSDRFSQWYCAASTPPPIHGLLDVLRGLGMFTGDDLAPGTGFSLNAANASLVTRETTSLNPRAVLYNSNGPFIALSYVRGGDMVEIAAHDPNGPDTQFYLLHYQLPCDTAGSCTPNDHYLPGNESGWTQADVYDGHADLKNSVLACDTCHRPRGFDYAAQQGAIPILLMQQPVDPWTHWFRASRGSNLLLQQYCTAHGAGEAYAGIPGTRLCESAPESAAGDPCDLVAHLIQPFSYALEPNITLYDGKIINNDDPRFAGPPSDKWNGFYARSVGGEVIPPPYFAIDPFDPGRLDAATRSYQQAATGKGTLLDITDLYRAEALPYLGHRGVDEIDGVPATAAQIVLHRCNPCHSGKFTGSGNRDGFVASDFPDRLTADMREKVRQRLMAAEDSALRMPPLLLTELTPGQVQTVLDAL